MAVKIFLVFYLAILSLNVLGKTPSPLTVLQCFKLHQKQLGLKFPEKLPVTFNKFLDHYPSEMKEKWISARGLPHFERLKMNSRTLAREYDLYLEEAVKINTALLGDFGKLQARGKSSDSILAKLLRKDFSAFNEGRPGLNQLDEARGAIGDGIGTRLIIRTDENGTISPALIQSFVNKVSQEIRQGLRVTEILNYRAAGQGIPYLSEEQVKQIIKADSEYRKRLKDLEKAGEEVVIPEPIIVKTGEEAVVPSGYTSFHMNIDYPNGIKGEIQIRGQYMQETGEIQHLFYDLMKGKAIDKKLMNNPAIASAVEHYRKLSPEAKERMVSYMEEELTHARKLEAGIPSDNPELPKDIPPILEFDRLKPHLIHD